MEVNRRGLLVGAAAVALARDQSARAQYVNERITGPGFVVGGTRWLMGNVGDALRARARDTPFSVSLLCAMAYQESGYFWWRRSFLAGKSLAQVLRLIVLDDVLPRSAFPPDDAAFLADARYAHLLPGLVAAADAARLEQGDAVTGRLRYGYGLFQNDLQNIRTEPEFWTSPVPGASDGSQGLWGDADASVDYCLRRLSDKFARSHDVYRAVREYNGGGRSADVYVENVRIYERAIELAGVCR